MRTFLLLAAVFLVMISSVSAAVLTQDNASRQSINFSTHLANQNFTFYLNVPVNSSVTASWLGSIRGPAYEVISAYDSQVANFSCCKNSVTNDLELGATYAADQTLKRSYIHFNTSLDMSQFGSVELILPFNSPDSSNLIGNFNVTLYEVFENASWSETTITWNNQPCGVGHVPDGLYCNTSYVSKVEVINNVNKVYNCSSDRLRFNITPVAQRRKTNVSFLITLERNESYTGIFNGIYFCSKESGYEQFNNQSFPTQPSLYFDRFLYPTNLTVFINNSIANTTGGLLNTTNRLNLTLNASLSDNLSRAFRITPIPVTLQVSGPGTVEVSKFAWTYNINGLAATLQFNNTNPYVVSWSSGAATFIKSFVINNTGTADGKNCSITTVLNAGLNLAPYLTYPANFSVVNQSSTAINITVTEPTDGFYDNLINAQCSVEGNNETYITGSPINFVFSISSPAASAGGGGGGGVTITEVTNVTARFSPPLAELFYFSFPGSNQFEFTSYSNVILSECEAPAGFECELTPQKTGITLRSSIPYKAGGLSDKLRADLIVTGEAGQVGQIPVGITVIYASFTTLALAALTILGGAWIIKTGR